MKSLEFMLIMIQLSVKQICEDKWSLGPNPKHICHLIDKMKDQPTPSAKFTHSSLFISSIKFTASQKFTQSEVFKSEKIILFDQKNDSDSFGGNKQTISKTTVIAVVAVVITVLIAVALAIIILVIRKRSIKADDSDYIIGDFRP